MYLSASSKLRYSSTELLEEGRELARAKLNGRFCPVRGPGIFDPILGLVSGRIYS
jgi:hypothetical protein